MKIDKQLVFPKGDLIHFQELLMFVLGHDFEVSLVIKSILDYSAPLRLTYNGILYCKCRKECALYVERLKVKVWRSGLKEG